MPIFPSHKHGSGLRMQSYLYANVTQALTSSVLELNTFYVCSVPLNQGTTPLGRPHRIYVPTTLRHVI